MFCGNCGAQNREDIKFCIKCGADLTRQTPPEKKRGSATFDGVDTTIQFDTDETTFAVGSLFANRYEILDDGKKGGMGAVYKCRDTKLNKIVALKIIHPRLLSSQHALSRFRQEVAISQELHHPNIVKVFNLEEWENKEYFTMEWVEGLTLREVIVKRKAENIPFRLDEAYKIISQLSHALNHAHKYTIHRDIKPENILVTDEGEFRVKLTDFGIAKMLSLSEFTLTSMQMGTPYYMAPEQKKDTAQVDKRADIYALGVVFFELLTLENTIGLEMPSEINKDLPSIIDTIIKKAVATKPNDRYGDAKDFYSALKDTIRVVRDESEQTLHEVSHENNKRQMKTAFASDEKTFVDIPLKREREPVREYCLLCDFVVGTNYFKCKKCQRVPICERHYNAEYKICEDCAQEEIKAAEEKRRRPYKCTVTGMEFVVVPHGEYEMGDVFGDGANDEKPVHTVQVNTLHIGKYPVTQREWNMVMGDNQSKFKNGDDYPVETVSWNDVQKFIKKLNEKTGEGYCLPTEAEWEYAARGGGKKEKWAGTSNRAELKDYAWHSENSNGKTHPVGQKKPNGLGIYDLSGNVWEWVWDWYGADYYKNSPRGNPKGPDSGSFRILRGGSWDTDEEGTRSTNRFKYYPDNGYYLIGFRLARTA
jgi:formylglycine-generating enzyme required for sulfatase activity/tRNA A-37 threonylcarbamoyl transferase component Bud32